VEREHNSKYFQAILKNGMLKSMKGVVDMKNIIRFITLLKNGKTLLCAPDQDYGMKNSNEVNFFNLPAETITAPLKNCPKLLISKPFFLNN
jgi:Lauroyl/myristoyl acyltransferase